MEMEQTLDDISNPEVHSFFPSWSPDGTKLLFTRSEGGFMSNLYTYVMDISSLNVGPANYAPEHPWL